MALHAEFDHTVSDMKWEDVISTLQSVVEVLFGNMSNSLTPPPPPPPPCFPSAFPWPRNNFHPQLPGSVSEGCFQPWCLFQGANELTSLPELNWTRQTNPVIYHKPVYDPAFMQARCFYRQPEQQHLVCIQSPVNYVPMNGAESNPSPLSYPSDGVSACIPSSVKYILKKRPRGSQDNSTPYVKKPLNAFMLFMKEQREKVQAEHEIVNFAAFAKSLGEVWGSMSKEQKEKYFQQSYEEKRLHSLQYPNWSPTDNYGKKRQRVRIRSQNQSSTKIRGLPSTPKESSQQANDLCVTPVQPAVMEAYASHTDVKISPHTYTTVQEPPQTHSAASGPVCKSCHQPQVPNSYWPCSSTNTEQQLSFWTPSSH